MKSTVIIAIIIISVIVGMIGVIVFLDLFSNLHINITQNDCATYWNNYRDISIGNNEQAAKRQDYYVAMFFLNDCPNSVDSWKHNADPKVQIDSIEFINYQEYSWYVAHYQELEDPFLKSFFEEEYIHLQQIRKNGP